MRNVIAVMVAAIVANVCLAQAPQRPSLLNRRLNRNRPAPARPAYSAAEEEKFRQAYPSGTNEFGRTWTVQCEYEAFMKENPSGKNPFGMTFDEQRQFQLVQDKVKALSQAKVTFEQAKSQFETLSAMKERSASLSQDAKALYEKEFAEAKSKFEKAKADLDQLESSLTPEMIAEYERQKKAYDQKKKAMEDAKKAKEQKEKEEKEAQTLKSKKAAVAREELAGWPCASERNPAMLSVYGTNIQGTLEKCCNVEVIVNSASAFRRMRMSDATSFNLYLLCEKECHVVFSSEHTAVVESGWERGKGTCLIDNFDTDYWHKYDENGRLVKWGHFTKFAEYVWMTNQHAVISARLREAWAKKHGLTQEQAEKRTQELIEVIEESTKDGQRQQLQAIQEELKRVREAKAAEAVAKPVDATSPSRQE